MPNHIHGIIVINNRGIHDGVGINNIVVETPKLGVSTAVTTTPAKKMNNKYWQPGNIGVIINQYKRKCTIESRRINADFGWQSRFYDHIVRNNQDLRRIQKYIKNNPVTWKEDNFYGR